MTLYMYVREKKLYDQRFGEKNKLPILPHLLKSEMAGPLCQLL